MRPHPRKQDKLKKRLQRVLQQIDLAPHRAAIEQLGADLNADLLDCAAALLYIGQPHLFLPEQEPIQKPSPTAPAAGAPKFVRYRLDVGNRHQVTPEQIIELLVEESGVDPKRITRLSMHDNYTLVDLPDGMPADIFQLLKEASLAGHNLNIKRVKNTRKRLRNFGGQAPARI